MCAQASVIAPLTYAYAPAPLIARPADGTYTERQFIAPRIVAPLTYSAPLTYAAPFAAPYAAPYAYHAYAPAPIAYAAPAVVAAKLEPSYTAINRGAIHTAPLPGHSESTSSVNLEAAPGTL